MDDIYVNIVDESPIISVSVEGAGPPGPTGPAGVDGYTPQRGVDYWTDEDKQDIIDEVLEQVPGGGGTGENGATFTPFVSEDGVISWTNDKGLPNPDPVNIKGEDGVTPNLQIGTVETLEPGIDATATIAGTPENPLLNLGIPRGQNGETPVKGIDYGTEEEIRDIAEQAAELVEVKKTTIPKNPQIDYTVPSDSQIVYFDEIEGKLISDYGFTFARVLVENVPKAPSISNNFFAFANEDSTGSTPQIEAGNSFICTGAKRFFGGWINTATGQAVSITPLASSESISATKSQIFGDFFGDVISSICFKVETDACPIYSGTNIKVWFS